MLPDRDPAYTHFMSENQPLSAETIGCHLDDYLEVEFSFLHTEEVAGSLATLPVEQQRFVLQWTRRVATTNIQLAYQFVLRARQALETMEPEMISAWCLHAMDSYDSAGLVPAMETIKDLEGYREFGHLRASAALLESVIPVLQPFVQGLSGRKLSLEQDERPWTDGEVIYLPEMVARFDNEPENFQLYKALGPPTCGHRPATARSTSNLEGCSPLASTRIGLRPGSRRWRPYASTRCWRGSCRVCIARCRRFHKRSANLPGPMNCSPCSRRWRKAVPRRACAC